METAVVDDQKQETEEVDQKKETEDGFQTAERDEEQITEAVCASEAEASREETASEQSRIRDLCQDMFSKTADYLHGELSSTSDEYRLLERLNKLTIAKYADMSTLATNLTGAMSDLNGKYENLEPYLEQVEQLEKSVAALEQAAYRLDAYSKRLEAKFKQLEKK